MDIRTCVAAAASAVPVVASASSYLNTTSLTESNSLGYSESTALDQNSLVPATGGSATSLTLGASAYQSYYHTNSSGYRTYYTDDTTTAYQGTAAGGDAWGRSVLGVAPAGYDTSAGNISFTYSVNGASNSMTPWGSPFSVAVRSGMPVALTAYASDSSYGSGGGSIKAVVGIADAPAPAITQYTPQWTSVSGAVDRSVPLHIDTNLALGVNRAMADVPGAGLLASPYGDTVVASETIYLNGVSQGSFTWSPLAWNPGESGLKGLSGGSGFDLDLSGLSAGTASAELELQTWVTHYAYDSNGSLLGSEQIGSSSLTQTITVPEPACLGLLGVGVSVFLLGKRRA